MSLLDFGRTLAAEALRAVADRLEREKTHAPTFEEVDEPGELVPPEAMSMVASRQAPAAEEPAPPPAGSLAARGRKVGGKWAC